MDLPARFDCRPVIIELLKVLEKYPMSYWNLDAVLNGVRQEIDVTTPIRIDPDIKSDF